MTRKLTPAALARKARDKIIMTMFIQNYTQQAIADKVGMSQAGVRKRIKKFFDKLEFKEEYKIRVRQQIEELRTLKHIIWKSVEDREGKMTLGEMDRYIKLSERVAKLLGLDRPTKVALTDPSGEEEWQPMYPILDRAVVTGDFTLPDEETIVDSTS